MSNATLHMHSQAGIFPLKFIKKKERAHEN